MVHFQTGDELCLVAGKDITTAIYNRLWLGGHRSATTGKWVWGDGSSAKAFLGGKWSRQLQRTPWPFPPLTVSLCLRSTKIPSITTSVKLTWCSNDIDYQRYYSCELTWCSNHAECARHCTIPSCATTWI